MIDPRLEEIFRLREARDLEIDPAIRTTLDTELRTAVERVLSSLGLPDLRWRDFLHQTKDDYLVWRRRRHER